MMFRIGEFSKMAKTTVKTLHFYDSIGLLKPELTDSFTSYRLYSTRQLFQLHTIQSLRQLGFSIEEISDILAGRRVQEILLAQKQKLTHDLAATQDKLSRIEFLLHHNMEDLTMSYVVTIKEVPACVVYARKMHVASYNDYFTCIPETGKKVKDAYPGIKCATPEYCFITYPDKEYKESNINMEYHEAVDKLYPDFDDIQFKKLPAITVASILHKGPYSGLPQAFAFAFQWVEENGYTVSDTVRESYIDGIWNKKNEADWLTEIQVPVTKK